MPQQSSLQSQFAHPSKSSENTCPNCSHGELDIFYEAYQVPVHSCLMLDTEEEALKFPCGDVVLGFCRQCGFITNTVFDSRWSAYASNYEDQQSFSQTFNEFAIKLATRLIEKYDLREKNLVEIGCSKGDFLFLLCELGKNQGIGIDPSAVPGRVKSEVADQVTFIQDYYSEKYSDCIGDFLYCRHTLEHIQPTFQFMDKVRKSIGFSSVPVFFEIPDTIRVLREAAFEDIYYEHCSYFTPGSLAYLFRSCQFEIDDLYLDYGGQYLLIEAMPVTKSSTKRHPLEESLRETTCYVEAFKALIKKKLSWWKSQLETWENSGEKVVVWGSGSKCVSFLTTLDTVQKIQCVVDINPHRQGKFIPGVAKEIKSPEFLRNFKPDYIIVMNSIYRSEIQAIIDDMNVEAKLLALGDELIDF